MVCRGDAQTLASKRSHRLKRVFGGLRFGKSAGLVGFAIGTETLGSIVSPSSRCGVTGLRLTYGRVSRYGAMGLSWTMDKIGPLCRAVEDCAIVLEAIYGADRRDIRYRHARLTDARNNLAGCESVI